MIRIFNVYYPVRTVALVVGEALIVGTSLLLGVMYANWEDSYLVLVYEHGYVKIIALTLLVLLGSHWLGLYDTSRLTTKGELYFRLLLLPGLLAFVLAAAAYFRPEYELGYGATEVGLLILTAALFGWRMGFTWMLHLPILIERVYVLGTGERAQRLVQGLRQNPEIGVEVVGWTGKMEGAVTKDSVAADVMEVVHKHKVHRVIIAMPDRRGTMPSQELFELQLRGVKVEEATSWLERISGKIEVENLYPSWLMSSGGIRRSAGFRFTRRALSIVTSLTGIILTLPLIPLIVLAIKLDSPGSVFFTQARVGKAGRVFNVFKFRTMCQDAEATSGPKWADEHDARETRVGKLLRAFRLDDIPQLWCVLKGDMATVGPRPERPEFVKWLPEKIPYYGVRHTVRPGLTGWAQIKYKHVNTVEDAREELQYDLFYIKNASIGLDLQIMFQTIKTVLWDRSAW